MKTWDVIVVGAGPAGSTLARLLAHAGSDVAILDRTEFPRFKPCGGALASHCGSELDQAPDYAGAVPVKEILLRGSWTGDLSYAAKGLYLIDRSSFDTTLLDQARSAGAQFFPHCPIQKLDRCDSIYRIQAGHRSFQAKRVAACDGALSPTKRLLGLPGPQLRCCQAMILAPSKPFASSGTAIVDLTAVPQGYGWAFQGPAGWNAGLFAPMTPTRMLRPALQTWMNRQPELRQLKPQHVFGGLIPEFSVLPWYERKGVYLVGDAARLVDPLTGEGIFYALRSALLASQAILKKNGGSYRSLLEDQLLPELKLAQRAARRFRTLSGWFLPVWMSLPGFRRKGALFSRLLSGEIGYEEFRRELGKPFRFWG